MNRFICRVCGYVHEGELDEKTVCPVCHLGAEFFKPEAKQERDEHVFVDIDESNVAICRDPENACIVEIANRCADISRPFMADITRKNANVNQFVLIAGSALLHVQQAQLNIKTIMHA